MPRVLSLNKSKLEKRLAKRPVFLGLDYDGTLSPIVNNPAKATIPKSVKRLLKKLSSLKNCYVAIVSGRSLTQLNQLVGVKGLDCIGNHGFELLKNKKKWVHSEAKKAQKHLKKVKPQLQRVAKAFPGCVIEDKTYVLAIHYRMVKPRKVKVLELKIKKVISGYSGKSNFKWGVGKKVWEIRPRFNWNKGKAVKALIKKSRLSYQTMMYLGDDLTDETVFKILPKSGMGILVGKNRRTAARYRLASPRKVHELLGKIYGIIGG